jgi:hypothetical protein
MKTQGRPVGGEIGSGVLYLFNHPFEDGQELVEGRGIGEGGQGNPRPAVYGILGKVNARDLVQFFKHLQPKPLFHR